MKLNRKLQMVLFLFSVITILFILLIGYNFYMKGYINLEEDYIKFEYNRIKSELYGLINKNQDILTDWSKWDESYLLVKNEENIDDFVDRNIVASDFINYGIKYFVVLKEDKVFLSKMVKEEKKLYEIKDKDLLDLIKEAAIGANIYSYRNENIIINKSIITDSNREKTTNSTMVFAFFLDSRNVNSMVKIDDYNISILNNIDNNFENDYKVIKNDEFMKLQFFIPYINVKSKGVLLETNFPRELYLIGTKTFYELLTLFMIFLAIMTFILNLFLKRYIVNKILILNNKVEAITNSGNLDQRVPISKRTDDEIVQLKFNINEMLDKIQFLQNKIIRYAKYDVLTGCYNRRFGIDKLERNIKNINEKEKLTICFADVNNLKVINDTYGHILGDELLKNVAVILKEGIRKDDYVIRLGGDEFLVVLPKTSIENSKEIISEINKKVKEFNKKENKEYLISIAIGNKEYKKGYSVDYFIDLADQEMYRKKQEIKNK